MVKRLARILLEMRAGHPDGLHRAVVEHDLHLPGLAGRGEAHLGGVEQQVGDEVTLTVIRNRQRVGVQVELEATD